MQLLSGYQANPSLRQSLAALAAETFGLNLEGFYQAGCWTSSYTPFSIEDNGRILSNVSANDMYLLWNGCPIHALQLGTVMTAPDSRGHGFSRRIMEHIMEQVAPNYDLIYLFANESVLDFYPRFGFVPYTETEYSMDLTQPLPSPHAIRPLDITCSSDLDVLHRLVKDTRPVSPVLSMEKNPGLLRFYLEVQCPELAFYIENLDAIVAVEYDGDTVCLMDVLSERAFSLPEIVSSVKGNCTRLTLGFTPSPTGTDCLIEQRPLPMELFLRSTSASPIMLKGSFCFPGLSRA